MKNPFLASGPVAEARPQYLRILESGEIVKGKHFSEITQLYEVESASGSIFSIQSNRVSQRVGPEQAADFSRRQQKAG
jgi:hypothetical protein